MTGFCRRLQTQYSCLLPTKPKPPLWALFSLRDTIHAMPTTETKIWLALKSRIDTLSLTYPRAWPATKYEPSAQKPYLRIGKIAVDPRRLVLSNGRPHERTGMLMVTLVHPLTQDFSVYQEIQGQIAAHFADGTQMTYKGICVSVPSYPSCLDGYESDGWWNAPVSIRWRCVA